MSAVDNNKIAWLIIPAGILLLWILDQKESEPPKLEQAIQKEMKEHPWASKEIAEKIARNHLGVTTSKEETVQVRPRTGRTHANQSNEAYCLECIEGHTMMASTEVRHALDRYRTAKEMTPGVTEKVRVAIGELQGIGEDARNTEGADPKVKQGIEEILDDVRWIRKEYGLSGKGLTTGHGTEEDLKELKARIGKMQQKAYGLVEECPTCKIRY